MLNDEIRRCLETLDVAGMRRASLAAMPHVPVSRNDHDVLIAMHVARTQTESIAFKLRAYSHAWLAERGLPSMLPDHLRPKAERMYPRVVSAVGLSVRFKAPELRAAGELIRKAGEAAVLDCYADGKEDPTYVRPRLLEAMANERKRLFGTLGKVGR